MDFDGKVNIEETILGKFLNLIPLYPWDFSKKFIVISWDFVIFLISDLEVVEPKWDKFRQRKESCKHYRSKQ